MSSVSVLRTELRKAIAQEYGNTDPAIIYEKLKASDVMRFEDLKDICATAKVPEWALSGIFSAYNVHGNAVTKDKFITFIQDEVKFEAGTSALNSDLSKEHASILSTFVEALCTKRTQAIAIRDSLSTERLKMSNVWVFVIRMNPPGTSEKFVRLATLCRLVDEYNLSFDIESFIDAIFAFFGTKLDQLDFEQFSALIRAF